MGRWLNIGSLKFWRGLTVVAIIAGIGIGFAIGFAARGSTVSDLNDALAERDTELVTAREQLSDQDTSIDSLGTDVTELRKQAGELQSRLDETVGEIATLRASSDLVSGLEESVASLSRQLENVPSSPEILVDILKVAEGLENDRLLLVDLRKDTPGDREDAMRFWLDIKGRAIKSDASLSPKVDKVSIALPSYFNWLERSFSSIEESNLSYLLTGASGYQSSVDDFWEAFLLVVIDRIDALLVVTS